MNTGNQLGGSFGQPQPQPTVARPLLQQQPQQVMPVIPPPISLPTIVRAVFPLSPDQQQQIRLQSQPQQFVSVFPVQQIHNQNAEVMESAPILAPAATFQVQPAPAPSATGQQISQPKGKGQPKQPRQPKAPKKATKQQLGQQAIQQQQQQHPTTTATKTTHHPTTGVRLTKKQQEKEDYYNRKYQLLRKCIRSLVFVSFCLLISWDS